jgi:FkbM family methyltransferase
MGAHAAMAGVAVIAVIAAVAIVVAIVATAAPVNYADQRWLTVVCARLADVYARVASTCSRNASEYECPGPPVSGRTMAFPIGEVSGVSNFLKVRAHYEPWMAGILARFGDKTAVALDVGAHMGYHTVAFARAFDRVVAFEPNPETYAYLVRNVRGEGNVTCVMAGVAETTRRVSFEVDDISSRSRVVVRPCGGPGAPGTGGCVQVYRLDDLPVSGRVGFVKLDIEGGEIPALRGMLGMVRLHRPVILYEDHSGATTRFVRTVFAREGYRVEAVDSSNFVAIPDPR